MGFDRVVKVDDILGLIKLVGEDGAYVDLTTDLAALVTAIEAIGYEFTINGINFDGHEKIKTLMLPSDCASGAFLTFHHWNDAGSEENYLVPSGKVFIAFQALVWESNASGLAFVGETAAADTTPFTKEVLFLSNGTALPSMENCWGVFAAGKYVTASSLTYTFKTGSAVYGVEVDA